jgi:hypothetical protein
MYIADDARQKHKNAPTALLTATSISCGEPINLRPNSSAAKTKMFLLQCVGRINFKNFIFDLPTKIDEHRSSQGTINIDNWADKE